MLRKIVDLLKKDDRGAALVEFAIVLPVLIVLIMGIVEFGWIYNGFITITGAAREGARVAAINGDYVQAVEHHVVSLPSLKGVTANMSGGAEQFDDLTVVVSGDLDLIFGGSFFPFLDEKYSFTVEATMRRQFADVSP